MGSDFLKKTRPTIQKHIDTKRVALSTPDLFTKTPKRQSRCVLASIDPGARLSSGDSLIVEAKGLSLQACRGNTVVATFKNPPADVLSAVKKGGGIACGVVKRVHKLSGKAEVSIC